MRVFLWRNKTEQIIASVGFLLFLKDLFNLIVWIANTLSNKNAKSTFRKCRESELRITKDEIIFLEKEFIELD